MRVRKRNGEIPRDLPSTAIQLSLDQEMPVNITVTKR